MTYPPESETEQRAFVLEPRLIICESAPRLAPLVLGSSEAPRLRCGQVALWQARTWEEVRSRLAAAPASFVLCELTGARQLETVQAVARYRWEFPQCRVAVAPRDVTADAALAAGAVWTIESVLQIDSLIKLVRKHLALAALAEPEDVVRDVWRRLPWRRPLPGGIEQRRKQLPARRAAEYEEQEEPIDFVEETVIFEPIDEPTEDGKSD